MTAQSGVSAERGAPSPRAPPSPGPPGTGLPSEGPPSAGAAEPRARAGSGRPAWPGRAVARRHHRGGQPPDGRSGRPTPLTLRGVAREAGVAATSVYLHFADIESLVRAVADRRFGELVQAPGRRAGVRRGPVRAGAGRVAGLLRVRAGPPGPLPGDVCQPAAVAQADDSEEFPGRKAFQRLTDAVAKCMGVSGRPGSVPYRTADLAAIARHRQPAHLAAEVPLAAAGRDGHRSGGPPCWAARMSDPV